MHYQKTVLLRNLKLFVAFWIILELLALQREYCVIGHTPVCTKHESYINSRYVSYMETYKAKKWGIFRKTATRINFRWNFNTEVKIVTDCCHGYKPGKNISECVPVCPSGCNNGECFQPNICKCFPGFVTSLNTRNGYTECVPNCPGGCNGGTCTAPNMCTCDDGYQSAEDGKSCEAVCFSVGAGGSHGCGDNAACIAPDICQCHDGYENNPIGPKPLCQPICIPPCGLNAFCDSPSKCLCNSGYVINTNRFLAVSRPPISNDNDMTSEPLFVTTRTTFNAPSMDCQPLCVPNCGENSSCFAPNMCQCDPGYRSVSSSNTPSYLLQCQPVCEQTCVNALCAYPNKCICHLGYKAHSVDNYVCVPICQNECIHASCIQPDQCECYDGYVKEVNNSEHHEKNSTNQCIPSCPDGCPNGKCVAPGQCVCDPGYILTIQETTSAPSTKMDFSRITSDITGYDSTDSREYYSTDSTDYYSTDSREYYSTDSTDSYSTDSTDYYSTDSADYYSNDGTDYYSTSTDRMTYSSGSSSTIAPISQQICQPLCEPDCPSGLICIAPPNQCELKSGSSQDVNNFVTDRTLIKNYTNNCDGNGTGNGSTCNTVELVILSHTARSIIGTIILLAIMLGIGLAMYLTLRKRKKIATHGIVKNTVGMMDQSDTSDPLFTTDESSYL